MGLGRFYLKLAILVSLQAIPLIGLGWRYVHLHQTRSTYSAATLDKQRLLHQQDRPRLILVGGSSTAFGVDSGALAESAGLHPVNMGIHIGLGLAFMLNEIQSELKRGDVVVITPEYELFNKYYWGTSPSLWLLLEARPASFRFLAPHQQKALLDSGLAQHIGRAIRVLLRNASHTLDSPTPPQDPIYQRKSFDRHGDMVAHLGKVGSSKAFIESAGRKFGFQYSDGSCRLAFERLQAFNSYCQGKGVRVYLSHVPLVEEAFRASQKSIEALESALKATVPIPMLDSPHEAAQSAEYFFDAYSHLNSEGRKKRTRLLATRLGAELRRTADQ